MDTVLMAFVQSVDVVTLVVNVADFVSRCA